MPFGAGSVRGAWFKRLGAFSQAGDEHGGASSSALSACWCGSPSLPWGSSITCI